jgi:hypothetical protein
MGIEDRRKLRLRTSKEITRSVNITHLKTKNIATDTPAIIKKNEEIMLSYREIIEVYEKNKINYEDIRNLCEFNIVNNENVDVSIIIPVKGREDFNDPLTKSLISAMEFYKEKKYSITFVEHSEFPSHKKLCEGKTNHIWIKKHKEEPFNKCLAMNVGFLFSNKSLFYLFHDVDLLVKKDFFYDIFRNLSRVGDNCVLQSFGGRKVAVMNQELSESVINNIERINTLNIGSPECVYSTPGAPGGSIFISHDNLYKLGGFDAEFFHSYSFEDAFFYHKAELMVRIQGCDFPWIDVFHMEHPRKNGADNPDIRNHKFLNDSFMRMLHEDKIKIIIHISNNFKKNKNFI